MKQPQTPALAHTSVENSTEAIQVISAAVELPLPIDQSPEAMGSYEMPGSKARKNHTLSEDKYS